MKTIIAGSREIKDLATVYEGVAKSGFQNEITEVVSGCAQGVDKLGEQWAREHGLSITSFPANWKRHGKMAGPIRNAEMAAYADALIAVWDGKSSGTRHMIKCAQLKGLRVHIHVP